MSLELPLTAVHGQGLPEETSEHQIQGLTHVRHSLKVKELAPVCVSERLVNLLEVNESQKIKIS